MKDGEDFYAEDLRRLVEELRVHQAELEVQNEELRVTQGELLEAQRRYADLFDYAPVGYMTIDGDGNVAQMNLALANMVGAERSALLGHKAVLLFHQEDPATRSTCFSAACPPSGKRIVRVRLRPGEALAPSVHVRLHGRPNVEAAPIRVAVVDITAQRLRQAERDASADLLQRTIDGIDEPLMVVGLDHDVRFANRQALGKRGDGRFARHPCFQLLHGWERACPAYGQACPLEEILRRPRPVRMRQEHVTADGSTRTIELVASPFYGSDGSLEGIIERSSDITDELRRDRELEHAHRLESLGVLAGGVAHDFNNLLAALQGATELAWNSAVAKNEPPDEHFLETVRGTFARATSLTKQLLTFSRGGAPVARACLLEKLVVDAATLATSGSRALCEFDIPAGFGAVHVDPGQFGQVVHNVTLNALQAMPEGGTVHVSVEETAGLPDATPSVPAEKYAKLVFRDEGPGIPPVLLDRIFEALLHHQVPRYRFGAQHRPLHREPARRRRARPIQGRLRYDG